MGRLHRADAVARRIGRSCRRSSGFDCGMMLLAHSPQPDNEIPAQSYAEHIEKVIASAVRHTSELTADATDGRLLKLAVQLAAEFHDIGKLDPENQAVLSVGGSGRLPVNHVDAGVAHLLKARPQLAAQLAAILVFSHHRGLPDITEHRTRDAGLPFRDLEPDESGRVTKDHTDGHQGNRIIS